MVNIEIHLCSSGVNSDLRESFFANFWGLCKRVIAQTDLWPQEMFTFFENACEIVAHFWGLLWKQPRCHPGRRLRLSTEGGLRGSTVTSDSCFLIPTNLMEGKGISTPPLQVSLTKFTSPWPRRTVFGVGCLLCVNFEMSSLHLFWCFLSTKGGVLNTEGYLRYLPFPVRYLEDNRLTSLPDGIFHNLPNLQVL